MMKKLLLLSSFALFLLTSCRKEEATPGDNKIQVSFSAGIESAIETTKVSITPNQDESVFAQSWSNGDIISFSYSNGVKNNSVSAVWNESVRKFTFYISEEEYNSLRDKEYNWTYEAEFLHSDWTKTYAQAGNNYSDGRDYFIGSQTTSGTLFGDGISIDMNRKTTVLFFDLSSADVSEPVTRAVLRIGAGQVLAAKKVRLASGGTLEPETDAEKYNETILTLTDGQELRSGIQLWFNTLPVANVTEMCLDVETSGHIVSIARKSTASSMNLAANTLTKIKTTKVAGHKLLFETFSGNSQIGGNDGIWNGENPSVTAISSDLSWETGYAVAANSCIRVGSSQNGPGYAQSPQFTIPEGKTASVTLRAGAVSGDHNKINVKILQNEKAVFTSEQELSEGSLCTKTISLGSVSGTCRLKIEGNAATGKSSRFYLDDIKVVY